MMSLDFKNEFWSRLNSDVVFYRKWYLSMLSDELLKTSVPNEVPQSLKQKLEHRRSRALELRNDPQWPQQIYQAVSELTLGHTKEPAYQTICSSHLMNPLEDYINHLYFFSLVAEDMGSKGLRVLPVGPNCSRVHDLDKLDPVMLVAYAERFEDGVETDLWTVCVRNHVTSSPHHPEHPVWKLDGVCPDLGLPTKECGHCEGARFLAVREMVADRVSRRVQKDLGGTMGPEAWDISPKWFSDLPGEWYGNALDIIRTMKNGWELDRL